MTPPKGGGADVLRHCDMLWLRSRSSSSDGLGGAALSAPVHRAMLRRAPTDMFAMHMPVWHTEPKDTGLMLVELLRCT